MSALTLFSYSATLLRHHTAMYGLMSRMPDGERLLTKYGHTLC